MIPDDDKGFLRAQLPSLLENDSLEIYTALSTVLAIISKHDFPVMWPSLLGELLGATTTSEAPTSYLTALHFVVKCLASLHESAEYHEFDGDAQVIEAYNLKMSQLRDFSPDIVMGIVTMWGEMTAKLVTQIGAYIESEGQLSDAIDPGLCYDSLYAFKILDTLLVSHLPTLHQANPNFLVGFCTMVASRIENISTLIRITQKYPGSIHLNKLYKRLIRFVVHLQRNHPLTFTPVLLSFLNFFLKEFCDWKDEWRGIMLLEIPLIYYMEFISNVLGTAPYSLKYLNDAKLGVPHKDPDVEVATAEGVEEAHRIVNTFFSQHTLVYLIQTIIGRFFKIFPDRLELWEDSPDVYYEEDMTEAAFTVKNTAEHLFYRIMSYDTDMICTEILRLIGQVRSNCAKENPEEVSLDDILLKNACMTCLAYAYVHLSSNGMIDFEVMQKEMFDVDLENPDPRYKYIRQTIAQIIGAWADDIDPDSHKRTWETLLMLFTDTDTLVKLTTFKSINNLLSSMDLDYEPYSSCIKPSVDYVLAFLREHFESPFAMPILTQLRFFVTHLSDRISPYTTAVVNHIKEFWAIADQSNRTELKKPIVEILASLAESLPEFAPIYDSVLEVTRTSTDLDHPDSVLLLESGLRLWWTIAQKSDNLTSDLMTLFPRLSYIYTRVPHSPMIVSMTIRLLESYFILDGAQIVQSDVQGVSDTLERLVATSRKDLILSVLDLLITFLQLFPADGPAVLRPALVRTYHLIFYRGASTRHLKRAITVFMHLELKNPAFFHEFLSDPSLNSRNGIDIDTEAPLPLTRLAARAHDLFRHLEFIESEQVWAVVFSEMFASGHPAFSQILPGFVDAAVSLILTLRKQTKSVETRKRYTEHSDVLIIKGSTVHTLRHQLKHADISKAKLPEIEQMVLNNIIPTLRNLGQEFENQIAAACEQQTKAFLSEAMSAQ